MLNGSSFGEEKIIVFDEEEEKDDGIENSDSLLENQDLDNPFLELELMEQTEEMNEET